MMNISRMNLSKFAGLLPTIESLPPAQSQFVLRAKRASGDVANPRPQSLLQGSPVRGNSILVPLDGSPLAEHAIPFALAIAEQTGAAIELVHVVVPTETLAPYEALYFADDSLESQVLKRRDYLEDVIKRIGEHCDVLVNAHVIEARSVPTTLAALSKQYAGLVVMATRGKGMWRRFWSGSVAHSLLQRLTVPTIFVPGEERAVELKPRDMRHILLPFEGSDISRVVYRSIVHSGLFPHAQLSLLHVVPLVPKRVVLQNEVGTQWTPSWEDWFAGVRHLKPLARALRRSGRKVETRVASSTEPFGEVVLAHSKQNDVDLIAVAHGPQGVIGRLLWPSASQYLFRKSPRPVLFVPAGSVRSVPSRQRTATKQGMATNAG